MNEAKVYADNYGETFTEERHFLDFLTSRSSGAWWQKETTQDIQFRAMGWQHSCQRGQTPVERTLFQKDFPQ